MSKKELLKKHLEKIRNTLENIEREADSYSAFYSAYDDLKNELKTLKKDDLIIIIMMLLQEFADSQNKIILTSIIEGFDFWSDELYE